MQRQICLSNSANPLCRCWGRTDVFFSVWSCQRIGCVDHIPKLRRTIEHRYKCQQLIVSCFMHFRATFDAADRQSLWSIHRSDKMLRNQARSLGTHQSPTQARVCTYDKESLEFALNSFLHQWRHFGTIASIQVLAFYHSTKRSSKRRG